MNVPHDELIQLAPALRAKEPEEIKGTLMYLGFEAEILEGESIVYDLHITPNRGDALSVLGIARELQAFEQRTAARPAATLRLTDCELIDKLAETTQPTITLKTKDCTQYHAVILEDVTIQPSPAWLQQAVSLFGHRPINNIVDLTNYLMELYGQPLHAFDLDAILGDTMTIRSSAKGETITTLDGIERILEKGAMVIEDEQALIDLAGIMGGANSAVDHRTKRVLLQSAIFSPESMRHATEASKHASAASYRYIRGIDPLVSLPVLNEAIRLVKKKEFGSMKATGKVLALSSKYLPTRTAINPSKVNHLLGTDIPKKDQVRLLQLIGCVVDDSASTVSVESPSWRSDLGYWQDYAEEIVRIQGIQDSVPEKRLPKATTTDSHSELAWIEGIKDRLVELGFSEILSYSFISKEDLTQFQLHKVGELANPLNPQLKYLRPSLLPNLAGAIGRNSYFEPVLLFEVGHVFTSKDEQTRLGIAIASQKESLETWAARIADAFGIDSSELLSASTLTTISQSVAQHYRVRKLPAYLLEIPIEKLTAARRIPHQYVVPASVVQYKKISKYPPIVRDLSLIVSTAKQGQAIADYIAKFHPFVEYVSIFDEFVSLKIGTDKKSIAFHILYSSPERTLNQVEIEEIEHELIRGLEQSFEAIIR